MLERIARWFREEPHQHPRQDAADGNEPYLSEMVRRALNPDFYDSLEFPRTSPQSAGSAAGASAKVPGGVAETPFHETAYATERRDDHA